MGILKWYNRDPICQQLVGEGWHSPDTYSNFFAPVTDDPAIYLFLIHDRDNHFDKAFVGYVGMAKRLKRRLLQHPVLSEISDPLWPMRWFLSTPLDQLRAKEREHIRRFDPPWNINGRQRGIEQ